jgi:hypothetical protein
MNIALTIDYELWGNGAGCVFKDVINKTEKFLSLCNQKKIKSTIFFEVVEYWKLQEEWSKGNTMGYKSNPAEAMKKQIQQAHKNGHDVQLHLHPQWVNAKYVDNKWMLDNRFWRLSDVPLTANQDICIGLKDLIQKGKECIEEMLYPIHPNYKCNIIRAGGFNIDPSKEILKVLSELDFEMDSSVYPRGYENGLLSKYDFRKIDGTKAYWFVNSEDVRKEGKSNIIELSMYAKPVRRIFKYGLHRLMGALKNRKQVVETVNKKTDKKSKIENLKYLLSKESVTFDFCLFSKSQFRNFYKASKNSAKKSYLSFFPIVLIGHSKAFDYINNFIYFVDYLQKRKSKFLTLTQINERIRKNNS